MNCIYDTMKTNHLTNVLRHINVSRKRIAQPKHIYPTDTFTVLAIRLSLPERKGVTVT